MFADTHVHPMMKYVHQEKDNLWNTFTAPVAPRGLLNNIIGIPAFSQSDMRRLAKGGFQLIFCALHPPEQQILFTSDTLGGFITDIAGPQVASILKRKIEEYRKPDYDHFDQLDVELKKLILGQSLSRKLTVGGKRKKCSFQVVKDFSEVKDIIDFNDTQDNEFKIALVLTVEGLHALGRGHVDFDGSNPHNVSDEEFMLRLDRLKGITNNDGHGWAHTPVVMNITHAFDNTICGHAQALAKGTRNKLKYPEQFGDAPKSLNQPLSTFGEKVIKRMLNIDANPAGKRIIPDIKHMSTATRRDYYAIIDTHNQQKPHDIIPVIMSHAAVNGEPLLNESNYNPEDKDKDYEDSKTFNPWSINLYDDEIIRIHKTKGLIGLIMDQRVLAGGEKIKQLKCRLDEKSYDGENPFEGLDKDEAWFKLVFDQIVHIVKAVINSNSDVDKKLIWDRICIGSDFDGQIDPINAFKKATDFYDYRDELADCLDKPEHHQLKLGLSTDEIVDKICFDNVYGFIKAHYN
ncbi:MAG: hypothetical protein AAGA02_14530 [Bacteroidota bacterium]